jgi:hypothetical protein
MTAGKATGKDRDYQVFCRDLLLKQYGSNGLRLYEGDGIDVPFDVGGTPRTLDVALVDCEGNIIVAECRRRISKTKGIVNLTGLLCTASARRGIRVP